MSYFSLQTFSQSSLSQRERRRKSDGKKEDRDRDTGKTVRLTIWWHCHGGNYNISKVWAWQHVTWKPQFHAMKMTKTHSCNTRIWSDWGRTITGRGDIINYWDKTKHGDHRDSWDNTKAHHWILSRSGITSQEKTRLVNLKTTKKNKIADSLETTTTLETSSTQSQHPICILKAFVNVC